MKEQALERHILDTVKEWQIKIGYQRESMRLYYPNSSIAELLELPKNTSQKELSAALQQFRDTVSPRLGEIAVSFDGGRCCLEISEKGCEYIHQHVEASAFFLQFIDTIMKKPCTLERIQECFAGFDKNYHYEQMVCHGLGHVFYFDDQRIDPYVYCVEMDESFATYHRFTRQEYNALAES
ncbi:MAG: DUF3877 family protein [Clostridiaceae bacterium]|nr:DUF3877 family protein [Clostridiaceae bacterium]